MEKQKTEKRRFSHVAGYANFHAMYNAVASMAHESGRMADAEIPLQVLSAALAGSHDSVLAYARQHRRTGFGAKVKDTVRSNKRADLERGVHIFMRRAMRGDVQGAWKQWLAIKLDADKKQVARRRPAAPKI